jgi:hypothetical protein
MSRDAMATLRAKRGPALLFVSKQTPIAFPDTLRYFALRNGCNFQGQYKSSLNRRKENSTDIALVKPVTNDS